MTNVKNALLTIPSDGKPFVYKIQVCYIMLEIRYPVTPISQNSLPLVAHYVTLNQSKFSNSMEIARFIEKKTKEQIMTCDYSGTYDAEHLERIVGKPGFSYKKLFRFILSVLFMAIHLTLLGLSIMILYAILYTIWYHGKPVAIWVHFLLRVKAFIFRCLYRLMRYIKL